MRTTQHGEICISMISNNREEGFYMKQKDEEREQTDRETERDSERVCARVGRPRR
jgi:hypothetical protein